MVILGVDPALTVTGYGAIVSAKNKLVLLRAGVITTSSRQKLTERLEKIYNGITQIIVKAKPDVLVLEKLYAHYRHPTTAYILGQARGIICLACAKAKVPLVEYAATRIKKAIVGKGQAQKYQVQRMVADMLRVEPKILSRYTDITDALALAIAHNYISEAATYGANSVSEHKLHGRTYPHTNWLYPIGKLPIGVGINSHSDLCRIQEAILHKSRAHS